MPSSEPAVLDLSARCRIIDWITLDLPPDASQPLVEFATQNGRDQTAAVIRRGGWEAFEKPLPAVLYSAAREWPGLVLDVGANTGYYTLLALAADARNRVLAFEPVPALLELVNQNVRRNDLQHRVRLIRCAASDRNGQGTLYIPVVNHGNIETSASLKPDFKFHHSGTLAVLQRTIDRVMFRPSLVTRRVSLIKIDVEGWEPAVLRGAYWTIRRHRPIVFIEVLRRADVDDLNEFVIDRRYTDVRLRADGAHRVEHVLSFDDESLNHALVPRERLAAFLSCVKRH